MARIGPESETLSTCPDEPDRTGSVIDRNRGLEGNPARVASTPSEANTQ
ncbi:hypothetical protein [Halostella pelagica]|nr:hypothetical protein [Halostella pelagica]